MSLDIFWFLPTSGDTRYLGKSNSGRTATNEYLQQIAVAADNLGYDGILIPTGSGCLDPWVTASSVASVTRHLKLRWCCAWWARWAARRWSWGCPRVSWWWTARRRAWTP